VNGPNGCFTYLFGVRPTGLGAGADRGVVPDPSLKDPILFLRLPCCPTPFEVVQMVTHIMGDSPHRGISWRGVPHVSLVFYLIRAVPTLVRAKREQLQRSKVHH
jgi:hypothetical protein